jgi:hypothetical protein
MKAETRAELRQIMRGDHARVAPPEGVTDTSPVTPGTRAVTPVTPVTSKIECKRKDDEGSATPDDATLSDAIEERAGLAADSVPPVYLGAWAGLNHQKPLGVSEGEWRRALDDGGLFLDQWGSDTAELGWTPDDLFGVNGGLVWRLAGERVKAISADHARLSDWSIVQRVRTRGFG